MSVEQKTEKFQMAVSAGWIQKVDDWRFANRIPSRATAIRQLVDKVLEKEIPTPAGE